MRPPCCSASARSSTRWRSSTPTRSRPARPRRPRARASTRCSSTRAMMIHPPMLYSGYTLMSIPFAFAVGALISGKLSSEWIRDTRRFALAAWLFLGAGIMLGAQLVLHRARLGRLLGLGCGRERGADAVAVHHRVHPLDPDPGEARDAEGLERLADPAERHAGDLRHVPRALGRAGLDPRLRRLDARRPVRDPARRDGARLDRAGALAARLAALRAPSSTRCSRARRCSCSRTWCSSRWCS